MSHYDTLGISPQSTQADVKAAYRKLVKMYHPDINPDASAAVRMIAINEAYEVLSSVSSRNLYDLYLQGVPVKTEIRENREQQRHREAYRARKVKQERERIMFLVKLKSVWYRYIRYANVAFFSIAVLFTLDYYIQLDQRSEQIDEIGEAKYQTGVATREGSRFTASRSLYLDFKKAQSEIIEVKYSLIFDAPAKVGFSSVATYYPINETIYVFRNAFSIIIIIFSSIVLKHKEYTDLRLSCGLVPGFIVLFLLLFVATEMV